MSIITCSYKERCKYRGSSTICQSCSKNRTRNMEEDLYEKANDKPIPERCPKLTYDGPAEHTLGYECPVCGHYTNPYSMRDCRCSGCGYKLNV